MHPGKANRHVGEATKKCILIVSPSEERERGMEGEDKGHQRMKVKGEKGGEGKGKKK